MPIGVYVRTKEHGRNISKAKKGCKQPPQCGYQKGHTDMVSADGRRNQALKMTGFGNPMYGTKWMHNTFLNHIKRVQQDQVQRYVDNGWEFGLSKDHIEKRRDYAPQLWALLMLELWCMKI